MPTANYFGASCMLDESVLHAGTMFWDSRCYFGLPIGAGTLRWPYIFSFWSSDSHTRPAERQMVTLLVNQFLYWIGAFSKRESDLEGRRYPSAREPGVCSGRYPIPAMQHKPTAGK